MPQSLSSRDKKIIGVGVGGAILVAGYIAVAATTTSDLPSGTKVAGVDVGGLNSQDAQKKLASLKAPLGNDKATITANGGRFTVNPNLARTVNPTEAINDNTGFTLNPVKVWHHVAGHDQNLTPEYPMDSARLKGLIDKASSGKVSGLADPGTVKFISGKVVTTPAKPGKEIDSAKLAQQIASGWPKAKSYTATLSQSDEQGPVAAAMTAFAHGDAQKAMSKPLKVSVGKKSYDLNTTDVSDVISTEVTDGKPHIKVDEKAFLERLDTRSDHELVTTPIDAKVVWKDGKPSVQPSKDGTQLDVKNVGQNVAKALVGNHKVTIPTKPDKAVVTASDIKVDSLPTTSISHFDSAFPTGPSQQSRIKNITVAINKLNGIVVQPGQQFSLLRALQYDFSKEAGYVPAGTLQGGLHIDGMAGGVSQVSTTMYNASFFAGVQLDEHTPHGLYIDRYPMGREATIWNPGIDNRWTNNTGHPILIKASVQNKPGDGKVVMDFYGTKKYDVETRTSERYNYTSPKFRVVRNNPACVSSAGGSSGFDVDVFRTLKQGGKVVKTEKVHTTYNPDDIISCQ